MKIYCNCAVLHRRRILENYEFEYRLIHKNICNSSAFSANHKSVDYAKAKQFEFEYSSKDKKLSINTLIEEVKPIVMEKS